jgi:hypothetical protein
MVIDHAFTQAVDREHDQGIPNGRWYENICIETTITSSSVRRKRGDGYLMPARKDQAPPALFQADAKMRAAPRRQSSAFHEVLRAGVDRDWQSRLCLRFGVAEKLSFPCQKHRHPQPPQSHRPLRRRRILSAMIVHRDDGKRAEKGARATRHGLGTMCAR